MAIPEKLAPHQMDILIRDIHKNKHSVDTLTAYECIYLIDYIQKVHDEYANKLIDIWPLNKDTMGPIEDTLERHYDLKRFRYAAEIVQNHYTKLTQQQEPKEQQNEPEDHTRYSKNQIFYLLTKLGLFNTTEFNKLIVKQEDKQKVVSKILGCAERTSKGLLNGEEKYTATPENIEIVDKFLKSISKEK